MMIRKSAGALLIAAILCSAIGCDRVVEQVGQLFATPTPYISALKTATPSPTEPSGVLIPTWTPFPTATTIEMLSIPATVTVIPSPSPLAATPIPQEVVCAALWDLYPQGEALVSEWSDWTAQDPSSPEAHKDTVDSLLERWSEYQDRLAAIPSSDETLPVIDLYRASIDQWMLGFTCASNAMTTLNPACGAQAADLQAEACELWYRAYDELAQRCSQCVSERPTPTTTPTATPQP